MEEKKCNKCCKIKALSEFYKARGKNKSNARRAECKQCFRLYIKNKYYDRKHAGLSNVKFTKTKLNKNNSLDDETSTNADIIKKLLFVIGLASLAVSLISVILYLLFS